MSEKEYILPIDKIRRFKFSDIFLSEYKDRKPNWGFGTLGWVTYKRTYSRRKPDGSMEKWWETCKRVVEGVFTFQKAHCYHLNLRWDNDRAQASAKEMYDRMFNFKWLPPGRGLWMMGTEFVYKRGGACLNNCGFVSTENIDQDFAKPFTWNFSSSMYGVGVGFDTNGAGKVTIQKPEFTDEVHVIGDSREGWTEVLRIVMAAHVGEEKIPLFDYSNVRPKGAPIKSFGGTASGPEPLKKMVGSLIGLFEPHYGEPITSELIVDAMNISGRCVVSGGVRRTAQISFGQPDDEQFLDLKLDGDKVEDYRWASNNSIFAHVGMDYSEVAKRTATNGEPGYMWLDNARQYGRMKDDRNDKDYRAAGGNPCLEQTLENAELCCLVETFPAHHEDLEDYLITLKYAYMYAKTVTLIPTHDPETNAVMMRNRRIGCSMSGIAQNAARVGLREHLRWCDEAYEAVQRLDKKYSEWLAVPRSIKTTSIKPSGTVSLLAGATPGIHWAFSPYYIRRVRVQETSNIWQVCEQAGYKVEDDVYSDNTKVIEFPVHVPYIDQSEDEVSIWEQVERTALHQYYWADNQVSVTVKFHPEEKKDIKRILESYEHRLKGVSFLPHSEHGFRQPPYEKIDKETYETLIENVKPLAHDAFEEVGHEAEDKFCDGEACMISFDKKE